MNDTTTAAVSTAAKPRERRDGDRRIETNWEPDPCLLTRRELQELIAKQLG